MFVKCMAINSSKGTSRSCTNALGDQISNREVRQSQISSGVSIMLCDTLVDSDLVELFECSPGTLQLQD